MKPKEYYLPLLDKTWLIFTNFRGSFTFRLKFCKLFQQKKNLECLPFKMALHAEYVYWMYCEHQKSPEMNLKIS